MAADAQHRELALKLAAITGGMFLFGFVVLPPLYDALCEITGLRGRTAEAPQQAVENVDPSRMVRVELIATRDRHAPIEFAPATNHIDVHPGQLYETTFIARNVTAHPVVAQAVPSVVPGAAARYLRKVECFCFESQEFAAEEERELKLVFMLDRELPAYTETVSLSYTLFALAN